MKIYSKVDGRLLHQVQWLKDIEKRESQREDIVDEKQFIQCSSLKMQQGTTFRPHKHIWKPGEEKVIAQESWVVIRGMVKCMFYDINDKLLEVIILEPGDVSFTYEGGHNYEIMEDDTIVYEYKTGPYKGQELDKTFLDE